MAGPALYGDLWAVMRVHVNSEQDGMSRKVLSREDKI